MNEMMKRTITASVGGIAFLWLYCWSPLPVFWTVWCLLAGYLVCGEWFALVRPITVWTPFAALLYPLFPWFLLGMYGVVHRGDHLVIILYPLLVAWLCDTAAYLVGRRWGKDKICPSISPGKSWQGLIGGIVAVGLFHLVLVGLGRAAAFAGLAHPLLLIARTLVYALTAFAGDVYESWLKRKAGVKDSGHVLPGHGGLLDRFDAVLFVIVLLVLEKIVLVYWH